MNRQQACKYIDQFGRVPEGLKSELVDFLVELKAANLEAVKEMGRYNEEDLQKKVEQILSDVGNPIEETALRLGTRLIRGGTPTRQLLERPKAKVLPWKERQ